MTDPNQSEGLAEDSGQMAWQFVTEYIGAERLQARDIETLRDGEQKALALGAAATVGNMIRQETIVRAV